MECYLRKPDKHELVDKIEKYLSRLSAKSIGQKESGGEEVTTDFVAYITNTPLKTLQLKLIAEFAEHLLEIFLLISCHSPRVDKIVDIYVEDSIKTFERNKFQS